MITPIKKSKFKKTVAIYLAMMILLETIQPLQMYALTGGPSQPEFQSFTPIGTSDMVDLASGDFNYNIPIMDVGGYPLNLAYNSGVTMDQEASWVGLGWDLNVGQIGRQLRGLPDDFNGDEMIYENNMKDNVTIGSNVNVFVSAFGVGENKKIKGGPSVGIGVKYNNYDGFGFSVNGGMSFQIAENLNVGMNMESSASEGVSVSPSVSFDTKDKKNVNKDNVLTGSVGVTYNSRKGVESLTMSNSRQPKAGGRSVSSSGSLSFIDASYTPTKRAGMVSSNFMFNLNLEGTAWGIEGGAKFSGYRTSQGIKDSEKYKVEKGYGFENTFNAGTSDILDFNREKDRTFNKNTTSLPITNNTYDMYSIQGQGVSGMFRPYKSQVGSVYDNHVRDDSYGADLGIEFGTGGGFHWGFDAVVTIAKSHSSVWENENPALNRFKEKTTGNKPGYEKVFFKNIGGTHVDEELGLFNANLGAYDAIKLDLEGSKFSRSTKLNYYKNLNPTIPAADQNLKVEGTSYIKRIGRLKRNQTIQKLTRAETKKYGFMTEYSPYSLSGKHDHHTSEIRVLKEGGERYIYGRAAYNVVKKEATFDVGTNESDCKNGLVSYSGSDNSIKNNQSGDQYFNRVTTPSYAHTYLLTNVLSADYQDIDDKKGPSDGDLGTYTKFEYENKSVDKTYKWRVPFNQNKANYDEGLRSSRKDNKGNYQYGEKELLYIKKIETKTHVAIFQLSPRNDGYGVLGENGGLSVDSKMYQLDKISLYSKPEFMADPLHATPIKEAHFVYDYSLCQGIDNNINKGKPQYAGQQGKLTLKKVYFTYKNSNMGKYTPYVFNYAPKSLTDNPNYHIENDLVNNPKYDMKAYDVWGNYKPVNPGVGCGTTEALSNAEYPFVDQSNKANADQNTAAWLLKSINLPSGGQMDLNYESDEYRHVQDREVMQMFKVAGAGNSSTITAGDIDIVNPIKNKGLGNYLYIQLDKNLDLNDPNVQQIFHDKYIKPIENSPVYFRFLLNMSNPNPLPGVGGTDNYDYVTGYLNIKGSKVYGFFENGGKQYVSIPIETVDKADGVNDQIQVNPIEKAGWFFGRQNLNRLVYSMDNQEDTNNIKGVVTQLIGWIPTLFDIFKSPNGKLQENGIASRFITGKSWIRLMQPDKRKMGGGSRVRDIKMHDRWDVMTGHDDNAVYKQFYGQQYSYETEIDKTTGKSYSSGVATYEPLGCKENPFVEPFCDQRKRALLLGPETENYVEKPFGESFFPSPKITYKRVTVKNLPREEFEGTQLISEVKKHATGEVVTEFYTSYDYPTLVDYTIPSAHYDQSTALSSILKLNVKDHLTMTQGYAIHTNDMDGKMKSQRVFAEGQKTYISGADYNYNEVLDPLDPSLAPNQGKLNNKIKTIDSKGQIASKLVGVDYDVINDFRESRTVTQSPGIHFNTAGLPLTFILVIVPVPLPSYSRHESLLRTAVTTKVIHTTGILAEKVAYDVGSKVSTKNLAWDAETGDVLLTETINEYNDKYFNFNFPAYWNYDGMSQAAKNLDLEWDISESGNQYTFNDAATDPNKNASKYLIDGDELWVTGINEFADSNNVIKHDKVKLKAWVVNVKSNGSFSLIDENGLKIVKNKLQNGHIKVIRSGHRNMQMASMASVTSMHNPFINAQGNWKNIDLNLYASINYDEYRIVNASAIEYSNIWPSQCECNLPKMVYETVNGKKQLTFEYDNPNNTNDDPDDIINRSYNPYKYNILGNWRANKSYAYLTGRNYTEDPTPRKTGFFNDFSPFYVFNGKWGITVGETFARWTSASEVTQYNPFGQEVENKDALNRYSSALYGYNNRFPVAVASNTKYKELAFDGFEDYDYSTCDTKAHFNFVESLEQNKVSVSKTQSHTGRRSLKLAPRVTEEPNKAMLKKQIVSCPPSGGSGAKTVKKQKSNGIKTVKK